MDSMLKDEEKALIESFISITSSSREEAFFFLESHNFQLDSAIHSFFENDPTNDQEQFQYSEIPPSSNPQPDIPSLIPNPTPSIPNPAMSSRGGGGGGGDDDKKKRIRTLADLHNKVGSGSDSESDGPQEYYTGGGKSGMLVQDPMRGGHDVDAIFDQARQMGAMQGPFEHPPSSSSRSFTGTGRLLSGETVAPAPRPPESVVHNIYFWSNGFSVDDGPLRRFDDPANASFLESIKKSECPKELEPEDRRTAVNVNLMRKEENYPEPVKRVAAFQGVGRTLGGASSSSSLRSTEPVGAVSSPSAAATPPMVVDDSKPTTSIQLRLADGSRAVARFNMDHTVGDIRAFINNHLASSGRAAPTMYSLQTVGFPPKQLTDTTQTIEQAGLANSVVIQKL